MTTALLFTGHMVDLPDRAEPRFPASLEAAARERIGAAVDSYAQRGGSRFSGCQRSTVMGFASCARGGDILFHEECRRRGLGTFIALPFGPSDFVRSSVEGMPSGDWEARFWALWNETDPKRRHVLGLRVSDEAYGICNTRLLELARQWGDVHLIALWDGKDGDGPGGTADLVAKAKLAHDDPTVISPAQLRT